MAASSMQDIELNLGGVRKSNANETTNNTTTENINTNTNTNYSSIYALALLVFSTVFGMCTWFSAGAVLPQLKLLWGIDEATGSLLTMGVNFGFLLGALASIFLKLADRYSPSTLMSIGSMGAAVLNIGMLIPGCGFGVALVLRTLTGTFMALVYPMACKCAASHFVENRGVAIGAVVGSVGLGSASPHLVQVLAGGTIPWQILLVTCSCLSACASIVSFFLLTEGPHVKNTNTADKDKDKDTDKDKDKDTDTTRENSSSNQTQTPFQMIVGNSAFWWSTLGYCGHNWELYALWLWFKKFAIDAGIGTLLWESEPTRGASLATFFVVGSAVAGSVGAGLVGDKFGRTTVCMLALSVSIVGSLVLGWCVNYSVLSFVVALLWGIFAVSESAQYSAMTTELVDPSVVGNAVTMQFGIGFLFTMPGMFIVPSVVENGGGWGWAWSTLTPGTVMAFVAMVMLRRNTTAIRVANERGRPVM